MEYILEYLISVSLFNVISTFGGYSMQKQSLYKNSSDTK